MPAGSIIAAAAFMCASPVAVDGNTLRCRGFGLVRLIGIDAPEMPGHCRAGRICTPGDGRAARATMARLLKAGPVTCTASGRDAYGRILARCSSGGRDLSCAMLAQRQAVRRYSVIFCW